MAARTPDVFTRADVGSVVVTADDHVLADDDGAVFVPRPRLAEIAERAQAIWSTERRQADEVRAGRPLRDQLAFGDYLARRAREPDWTFRRHLRERGGAVEE